MPDDVKQREPFDEYCDMFTVSITPFGANLSFLVREAHPSPAQAPHPRNLGTVRMSIEHLKTMVMVIRRQVLQVEHDTGVKAELPPVILKQLNIPPEDWDAFWKY